MHLMLSSCGTQIELLCGIWDFPKLGIAALRENDSKTMSRKTRGFTEQKGSGARLSLG